MSIGSSLNAGVSGLSAQANKISTISDNIANSATPGYKRAVASFYAMVNGSQSSYKYNAGGVKSLSSREISTQGRLTASNNATDILIDGKGFFPVAMTNSPETLNPGTTKYRFATTGSYTMDSLGYLRNPAGYYLLGWELDLNGKPASNLSRDSVTTLSAVRPGKVQNIATPTSVVDVSINLPAQMTDFGATIPTNGYDFPIEYFDGLGKSHNLVFNFMPEASTAAGTSTNKWTMKVNDDFSGTSTTIAEYVIEFESVGPNAGSIRSVTATTGAAYDPATGNIPITTGASTTIDFGIGKLASSSGLTQYAGIFNPLTLSKNGNPTGNLSRVEVNDKGIVEAIFDSGARKPIYQIPVAGFINNNGLNFLTDQTYEVTRESGSFYFWDSGTGSVGRVVGFAMESSTVDIAQELTQLIETQRAYSSNAKIIQTVDEMLAETANLKR